LPANTGAWVYFTAPTTVVLGSGSTQPASVGLIPAQPWALLGDPSGTAPALIRDAFAYTYDPLNGYQPTHVLLPGRGVWVTPAQSPHIVITVTPASAFSPALTSVSFTSPCGAALGTQGYIGDGNGQALGEVAGQPVTLCVASTTQPYLPNYQGFGCLLVGGLLAVQHGLGPGGPACASVERVVSQGANQFLWVGLSGPIEQVTPFQWDGSSFRASPSYAVCVNNPTVPVTSADPCFHQPSGVHRANASAADAVAAFYTAVDAQQYAAAYALLSPAFQAQQPYNSWVAGYATTVVLGADVTQSAAAPNSVAVYLTAVNQSTDFQGVVARYSGTWTLVADGVGGWLLDSANIGVAAEPATYATAASDFTAFADSWEHHGFGLTLDASGDAHVGWRIYRWCSEDPTPPCDELSGNQIIDGGNGEISFTQSFGSSAVGTWVSSDVPDTLGATVTLTLLPFHMAVLVQNGSPLVLCSADRRSPDTPTAVTRACGA
jgi:hypothetical protein